MQFTNSFEVSLPPGQAWPLLMDVESIVPCMPGAEIVEIIDERTFKGRISVRLGPVGLVFLCDARFEEIDGDAMKAKIKASGADAKGRGTADAWIDFRCQPSAQGSMILISTDLTLSGAVAQYGRGVGLIQNVANQIIGQFARNLENRIAHLQTHRDAAGAAREAEPLAAVAVGPAPERSAGAPAVGDYYPQGYRDGFAAGFSSGHAAGYAAAQTQAQPKSGVRCGLPPFPPAKPIGGLSLIFSSLWATVRGWFTRQPH